MASYKIVPCRCCGAPVKVEYRSRSGTCKECRKEYQREYQKARYQRRSTDRKEATVEVIRDPSAPEDGAFPRGAMFSLAEYRTMLVQRYFAPGTVLKVDEKVVQVGKFGYGVVEIGG